MHPRRERSVSVNSTSSSSIEARLQPVKDAAAAHAAAVDRDSRFPEEALEALAREGLLGLTLAGNRYRAGKVQ
jgi:alkylation response protein AidB-like acyl-CoA dehydrogenase